MRNASPVHMPSDRNLDGRHEKRLPIVVVVCLADIQKPAPASEEKTYTDNVSLHGARVISRHSWEPGDEARVTPLRYGAPARAKVIYCKQLARDRYFVGLNFLRQPVQWSTFSYPGIW